MKLLIRSIVCILLFGGLMSCEEDPVSVEPVKDKWNVSYTVDSAYSRTVRFKLHIPKKIYLLSVHWDFGDGTTARLKPDAEVVHTYKRVGDYVVRAASDPTDSAIVSDTTWVKLKSTITEFRIKYRVDTADAQLVHFSLLYPSLFFADSVDWDFGDGTIRRIHTDSTHSHKYKRAEDYQVVVSYNHTEPTSVIDSVLVMLLNYATEFKVRYWLDPADPLAIHFNVAYPKGFPYDSLYWDFGVGNKQWIALDTSLVHTYQDLENYEVKVGSDATADPRVKAALDVKLARSVPLDRLKSFSRLRVSRVFDFWWGDYALSYDTLVWTDSNFAKTEQIWEEKRYINVSFNANGTLDITMSSSEGDETSSFGEGLKIRDIHCQSISDSLVVYHIGRESGMLRLTEYYAREWFRHGGETTWGLNEGRANFRSAKLEFYNK
jgi:hypothetical protein